MAIGKPSRFVRLTRVRVRQQLDKSCCAAPSSALSLLFPIAMAANILFAWRSADRPLPNTKNNCAIRVWASSNVRPTANSALPQPTPHHLPIAFATRAVSIPVFGSRKWSGNCEIEESILYCKEPILDKFASDSDSQTFWKSNRPYTRRITPFLFLALPQGKCYGPK